MASTTKLNVLVCDGTNTSELTGENEQDKPFGQVPESWTNCALKPKFVNGKGNAAWPPEVTLAWNNPETPKNGHVAETSGNKNNKKNRARTGDFRRFSIVDY